MENYKHLNLRLIAVLVFLLVAYGIAGKMDYEDAITVEHWTVEQKTAVMSTWHSSNR
jgi:hypothetical protein